MHKTLEIGIVGLGKFGLQLAKTLLSLGHKVVGIDLSEARVHHAQDLLDQVYRADASDMTVLRQLRFQDLDCVVVSVGESMEASLTVTLNLQDLKVPRIWVKAVNIEHRKILTRLGVEQAIVPELDVATITAHRLDNPRMLDLIPRYGGILVQEMEVKNWAGQSLVELDLMNKNSVLVLAVKKEHEQIWHFVPRAHTELDKGDTLMIVGRQEDVKNLES